MSFESHKWSEKCTRSNLRGSKIQKFPGGACPRGSTAMHSPFAPLPPLVHFSKWNTAYALTINRYRSECEGCEMPCPELPYHLEIPSLIYKRFQSIPSSVWFESSLASQPHSVLQRQSLSVLARGGRVWRLRTTLHEQLEHNYWISRTKASNLLHMPHPPNDSMLATRDESYCTLFIWVLCHGFVDEKSYVGHWDGTDQSLTRITASPLLSNR